MQPFTFFIFKNEPPLSPFAPRYEYVLGETFLENIDFEKISKFIIKKEKEIIKKYPVSNKSEKTIDAFTGLGDNSLTSRYENFNLLAFNNPEIKKVKKQIKEVHKQFLNNLKVNIDKQIYIQCWANVMRKGEQIKPHIHSVGPYTYLGGHICVKSKNTNTHYINPQNQINDPKIISSKNETGKITLFQNCLPHYTDKYEGEGERITIAFDLSIEDKSDTPSFIPL